MFANIWHTLYSQIQALDTLHGCSKLNRWYTTHGHGDLKSLELCGGSKKTLWECGKTGYNSDSSRVREPQGWHCKSLKVSVSNELGNLSYMYLAHSDKVAFFHSRGKLTGTCGQCAYAQGKRESNWTLVPSRVKVHMHCGIVIHIWEFVLVAILP